MLRLIVIILSILNIFITLISVSKYKRIPKNLFTSAIYLIIYSILVVVIV